MTDKINGISRETFDRMDVNAKLGILFDLTFESNKKIQDIKKEVVQLKKRGFYHKACSSAGGVIGGMLAAIGIKQFWN